jgi:hypothetical protein
MHSTFPTTVVTATDPRTLLTTAVLSAIPASASFADIQRALGEQSLALFGLVIDFTQRTDGTPVTKEVIDTLSEQALFPLEVSDKTGLGIDFALVRQAWAGARAGRGVWSSCEASTMDLAAVSRLDELRTVDLTQSRENLLPADHEPSLGVRV